MSQMERGERPTMQEQEDSEEGETPADPSAGECSWVAQSSAFWIFHHSGGPAWGVAVHSRPWRAALASFVQEGGLQVLRPA